MRGVVALAVLVALAAPAGAQPGLGGALDRADLHRALRQSQMRQEVERQQQALERLQEQLRTQKLIERQLNLRLTPIPCQTGPGPAPC